MSDSNKDLYGEREILNNYNELKRIFTPANVAMLLWQNEATLCVVLRSLRSFPRQITPAPCISPYKHCISAKITNIKDEKGAAENLRKSRYKLGPIIFHFKRFLRQNVASKNFLKKLKIQMKLRANGARNCRRHEQFCRFCSTKQDSAVFEHQSRKSLHEIYHYTWENRCFA